MRTLSLTSSHESYLKASQAIRQTPYVTRRTTNSKVITFCATEKLWYEKATQKLCFKPITAVQSRLVTTVQPLWQEVSTIHHVRSRQNSCCPDEKVLLERFSRLATEKVFTVSSLCWHEKLCTLKKSKKLSLFFVEKTRLEASRTVEISEQTFFVCGFEPLRPSVITPKIFWRVHMDLFGPFPSSALGSRYGILAVCAFSVTSWKV